MSRLFLSVTTALVLLTVSALEQTAKPISKKGLIDALNIGGLSQQELSQLVQQRGVGIECLVDRGLEKLFLAVEMVVERAHADVRGLRDLKHRHVQLPRRDVIEGQPRHPCHKPAPARRVQAVGERAAAEAGGI